MQLTTLQPQQYRYKLKSLYIKEKIYSCEKLTLKKKIVEKI